MGNDVHRMPRATHGQFSARQGERVSIIYDALSSPRDDCKRGIIRSVHELSRPGFLRKQAPFFLWASLAGLSLGLFLFFRSPGVVDASRLYADIADNWLRH